VSGNEPASIAVELLDVWAGVGGLRTTLPLGSTPQSGEGRVAMRASSLRYVPDGAVQEIAITVSISADQLLETPLSAAVRLTIEPDRAAQDGTRVKLISSAAAFVFGVHDDYEASSGEFAADIQISNLMVNYLNGASTPATRRSIRFVEGEFVEASFEATNRGSLFAFVRHELTVKKAGFWIDSESDAALVIATNFDEWVLTPGQSRTHAVPLTARLEGTNRILSLVEAWGVYELTVTTYHFTRPDEVIEQVDTTYFYVFPIRPTVFAVVLLGLATLLALRARRNSRKIDIHD